VGGLWGPLKGSILRRRIKASARRSGGSGEARVPAVLSGPRDGGSSSSAPVSPATGDTRPGEAEDVAVGEEPAADDQHTGRP
jgi:hypothetical protein